MIMIYNYNNAMTSKDCEKKLELVRSYSET